MRLRTRIMQPLCAPRLPDIVQLRQAEMGFPFRQCAPIDPLEQIRRFPANQAPRPDDVKAAAAPPSVSVDGREYPAVYRDGVLLIREVPAGYRLLSITPEGAASVSLTVLVPAGGLVRTVVNPG